VEIHRAVVSTLSTAALNSVQGFAPTSACESRAERQWLVRDADRVFWEGVGNRPALEDSLDLLEVLLDGLLPLLESFDVSS